VWNMGPLKVLNDLVSFRTFRGYLFYRQETIKVGSK
jgi:hypothetical protein